MTATATIHAIEDITDNDAVQRQFDMARGLADMDPEAALDMAVRVHRKALAKKAEASGNLSLINSKIRLLGVARNKELAIEGQAAETVKKAAALIQALEGELS